MRLALWCEAHGLEPERDKHLALAVLNDPGHATARGLMGSVEDGGRWTKPEVVAERSRADVERAATLDAYRKRREAIADTAEAYWQLAQWCEQNGLKAEALAHLTAVVRLNPAREEAWKQLGCRKQNRRCITGPQATAGRAEAEAQRKADLRWRALLTKWKGWLGQSSRRAEAEAALATVKDARAVPSIWKVFAQGGPADQVRAITLLRQIDAPTAVRGLASLAVTASTAEARRLAAEGLGGRDPREFAGLLIALVRDPVKYEVRQVGGPGTPGELYVHGEKSNTRRFYAAPPPSATIRPGDLVAFDDDGLPFVNRIVGYARQPTSASVDPLLAGGLDLSGGPEALAHAGAGQSGQLLGQQPVHNQSVAIPAGGAVGRGMTSTPLVTQVPVGRLMLQAQQQAELSRQHLRNDIARIDRHNDEVNRINDRATAALKAGLGEDLGPDRGSWLKWWNDLGAVSSVAPDPSPGASREPAEKEEPPQAPGRRAWLPGFEGGTPVWTIAGLCSIEDLRAGDKLLGQDEATGALGYVPVLTIRHVAAAPVRAIELGDRAIVATDLERFWVAGEGWVMARDLAPGIAVRALGGVVRVASVADLGARPVYHVQVPGGHGVFVGRRGILAHDNQVGQPVDPPFDSAAAPGAPLPGPST